MLKYKKYMSCLDYLKEIAAATVRFNEQSGQAIRLKVVGGDEFSSGLSAEIGNIMDTVSASSAVEGDMDSLGCCVVYGITIYIV